VGVGPVPGQLELIAHPLRELPEPREDVQAGTVREMGLWTADLAQHDSRVAHLFQDAVDQKDNFNEYSARLEEAATLRQQITLDEGLAGLGIYVPPLNPLAGEAGFQPKPPGPYPVESPTAGLAQRVWNGFHNVLVELYDLIVSLVP